jgi:23S rRNA pseudouridine2604 synthase
MCDYLNYNVKTLKRVRIMNIELDVPVGKYRELTSEEFKTLTDLVSDSKKTFQPQINRIKRK